MSGNSKKGNKVIFLDVHGVGLDNEGDQEKRNVIRKILQSEDGERGCLRGVDVKIRFCQEPYEDFRTGLCKPICVLTGRPWHPIKRVKDALSQVGFDVTAAAIIPET